MSKVLCDIGPADQLDLTDLAAVSRPKSTWKAHRTGVRGGAKEEQHTRTNWYHPFLWAHIDRAARKVCWSPQSIVNRLVSDNPRLFSKLTKGTIHKWIDRETKRNWSAKTKENVRRRHALAGSGQTGILAKHDDIVQEIVQQLRGLRAAGLAVNVIVARSIMLAIIEERQPDLLLTFKCSEVIISHDLRSEVILTAPTSHMSGHFSKANLTGPLAKELVQLLISLLMQMISAKLHSFVLFTV